ncbi:hypothetical protein OOJ91_12120 [Micromonospora lupini]|uniref:hypothetical protein n=1 Tax=Micromonospora lupini TaxID=285679 RepID=UPI00225116D7|nr:hypothetical protein [Micromonospora lupini]MCX5066624.1 hypothetical protein [Micromonospora lupini]
MTDSTPAGPAPVTPSTPIFDADTCEEIFLAALDAGDFQGVVAALTVMAPQDPHRAEMLLNTLRVGLAIADERQRATAGTEGAPT